MKKLYAVLNLLSSIGIIYWNYYTVVHGVNGNDVGEVSDRYQNLFTPAGYAFSIWGIIFLGLLALSVFHIRRAFFSNKESKFIEQTGPWFFLANIFNGLWVWFWLTERTEITPLIMVGLLVCLVIIILRTNMERWDAPIEVIAFQWWPICLYAGWITVALIANTTAVLVKTGWSGGPLNEATWAIIMIVVATLVNLLMIFRRNMREFAAVGMWALVAIAVKQWENEPSVAYTALICTVILVIAAAIHGYKNRATAPHIKLKQRLSN